MICQHCKGKMYLDYWTGGYTCRCCGRCTYANTANAAALLQQGQIAVVGHYTQGASIIPIMAGETS